MQPELIVIRRIDQTRALAGFSRMTDAIRHKEDRELGSDFVIDDTRPAGDAGRIADLPLVIGMTLRDALSPLWRATQMDRMLDSGTRHVPMPVNPAKDLHAETALTCMQILEDAGATGWSAWAGRYFDPPLGPPVLRNHTDQPQNHAWIEHDTGLILDVTKTIFDRLPVCALRPEDDRHASFFARTVLDDEAISRTAEAWRGQLGPALVARLHDLGAADMIRAPDEARDPSPGW